MEKKVNTEVLVKDFENWLDKYMQSWPDNEILSYKGNENKLGKSVKV